MDITFTFAVSGKDAAASYFEAFEKYDGESSGIGGDAALCIDMQKRGDGSLDWITATSGFVYKLTNPDSTAPAVVEYSGAWRAFLAQAYLPEVVRGETITARLIGGSVLKKYPWPDGGFVLPSAVLLVQMYGLLQAFIPYYEKYPDAREWAFWRIRTALQTEEVMNTKWMRADEYGLIHGAHWAVLPRDKSHPYQYENEGIDPGEGEMHLCICGEIIKKRFDFADEREVEKNDKWLKRIAATGMLE